jgi:hypothetical protein
LLQARKYIEYFDSIKEIHYAKSKIVYCKNEKTDYFYDKVSDTLRDFIYKNLYGKKFPQRLSPNNKPLWNYMDVGDYTCIIYKFEKEPLHIINYLLSPYAMPDSLKSFFHYIENLKKRTTFKPYKEFDTKELITNFKKYIIDDNPSAPPPAPVLIEQKVKFIGPSKIK